MFRGNTSNSFSVWDPPDISSKNENRIKLKSFNSSPDNGNGLPGDNNKAEEKKVESANGEEGEDGFKVPTRTIIIEPVMIMLFMFHMSTNILLSGQFVYHAIGEKYNLSRLLEAEKEAGKDMNMTDGEVGGGGACAGLDKENPNSTAYEAQQKTQSETAMFNFYMDLITDIPGLVFILFFGSLMDRFGRRPTLIIPMFGMIIRAALYPIQAVTKAPIEILFIGGFIEALTGGGITVTGAAFAYLADTIPPSKRGRRMIIADVSFGVAMAITTYLFGLMIEATGYSWPYLVVICGHILNLLYIIFFVPESRKPSGKSISFLKAPLLILRSFKVLIKKRLFNGRQLLLVFMTVWVLAGFGRSGLRHIDQLYKLNYPFCWSPSTISTYTSVTFLVYMVSQLFIGMVLIRPLGESPVILLAFTSLVAQYVVTGLATSTVMLWIGGFLGFAGNCQLPVMRAMFSRLVEGSEQGALNSCISAVDKIAGIFSSFFFNFIYVETLDVYSGTVFFVVAGIIVLAIIMTIIFRFMNASAAKLRGDIGGDRGLPGHPPPDGELPKF